MSEITFHERECDLYRCQDRECPYAHFDAWKFEHRYYETREMAEEAKKKALTSR